MLQSRFATALSPKPWRFGAFFLLAAFYLGGCACNLPLPPQGYVLEQAKLEQMLARRFPISRTFNKLVDVQVQPPQLRLDAAQGRVQAHIPMQVDSRLFGQAAHYRGSMHMSAGLAFDAQSQTVRLQQPALENFDLGPEAEEKMGLFKPAAVAILSKWMQEELHNYPLYELTPEQQKQLGAKRALSIQVQERGLLLKPGTHP